MNQGHQPRGGEDDGELPAAYPHPQEGDHVRYLDLPPVVLGLGPPEGPDEVSQDQGERKRGYGEYHRAHPQPAKGPEPHPVQPHSHRRPREHGQGEGEGEGEPELHHEEKAQVGPDHHQVPVGEVGELQDGVDEGEAYGPQDQDAPQDESVDGELQHGSPAEEEFGDLAVV